MTEHEAPTLTAVQIIELQRFEALILENLRRGKPPAAQRPDANGLVKCVLSVIRAAERETPEHQEKTKRHIELTAELITYLASEGIDHQHFRGRINGAEFMLADQACWILRQRRWHFAEPDSFGCQVLIKAGFRPPSDEVAQAG